MRPECFDKAQRLQKWFFISLPRCASKAIMYQNDWDDMFHHFPAHAMRRGYPNQYDPEKAFCVIRNPWTRAVSWYGFWDHLLREQCAVDSFEQWVAEGCPHTWTGKSEFGQWGAGFAGLTLGWGGRQPAGIRDYVTDWDTGEEIVRHFIRFEHLQKDYDRLAPKLGLKPGQLCVIDPGRGRNWRQYYESQDLIDGVARAFQWEIERFGYEFPG